MDIMQWGFTSKMKWVLVDAAPLTGSGLNEMVAAAETKDKLKKIAKLLGYTLTGHNGTRYVIVKLDDIPNKKEDKLEEVCACGHPYDGRCYPDSNHPGYSYCGRR